MDGIAAAFVWPGIVGGAALVVGIGLAGGFVLAWRSRRLAPPAWPASGLPTCTGRRGCVSSLADDPARRVAPLAYGTTGALAMADLRAVLEELPRAAVTTEGEGRVHAAVPSAFFGFVDDVHAVLDEDTSVIHVRAASRAGCGSVGVRRQRVEWLRVRVAARQRQAAGSHRAS